MSQTRPWSRQLIIAALVLTAFGASFGFLNFLLACGPWLTFRAYLKRSFWEPMYFHAGSQAPSKRATETSPYAGFLDSEAPPSLIELREAYRALAAETPAASEAEHAVLAAQKALIPGTLTGKNLEEAQLIDCKIALRLGEGSPALEEARSKLENFIARAQNPLFASEARGWLARVLYLQEDYVGAAKIYLDELDSPKSNLSRDTLMTSLRLVYAAGKTQLWSRLEEFFDTPRHALFVLNLVTNSDPNEEGIHQAERDANGRKALGLLQDHHLLFK
jgi:hypothetical protein